MATQTTRITASMNVVPTVSHPGPRQAERLSFVRVSREPGERFIVHEGHDLFTAIHDRLDVIGAEGAAFRLVAGVFAKVTLMTGGAGEKDLPIAFHGPHVLAAPAWIVAGAAGSGRDENGDRFSHCHAVFNDQNGHSVGGHLLADLAIAGPAGVTVEIAPIAGGVFHRRFDPETRFDLFHPEAA